MAFVIIYLIGYFALLGGAAFVLWQSGVMQQLPDVWVVATFMAAAALGLLLGIVSYSRTET
jgi:hypothetical protein